MTNEEVDIKGSIDALTKAMVAGFAGVGGVGRVENARADFECL